MGMVFKMKSVRIQAHQRLPELYIQAHKRIVDSGEP